MTPDRQIADVPFVDGAVRPVYEQPDGREYVFGYEGERMYGVWVKPPDEPVNVDE
jgi:hypothetical protein